MTAKEIFQANEWFTVYTNGAINSYEGKPYAIISVNEKHGSMTIVDQADRVCGRCGGQGGYSGWPGYTCFRCGGNGIDPKPGTRKIYTKDRAEKLSVSRLKIVEKKAAEGRSIIAARDEAFDKMLADNPMVAELQLLVAELWAKKDANEEFNIPASILIADDIFSSIHRAGRMTERQCEALQGILIAYKAQEEKKALMTHIGTEGQKMEANLTAKFLRSFPSRFGTMFIQSFEDAAGNCIVYKGSAPLGIEPGETKAVKFTVKKHDEYNGTPQTVMIRPKVVTA